EFVKIGVIISLAKFIEKNHEKLNELFTLIKVLIFAFIPVVLIMLQPDFGTAIVFVFFIFVMLFVAGLDWKYMLITAVAGIASLPIIWFSLDKYQKNRIFDFLDPSRDAMGSGYQVIQSKIAIGSGQIFGMGLYNGNQTQFGFLPEKHTDFIFSVIGEELGLIGGLALILLYFLLLIRLIKIAKNSTDKYGSIMVIGIAAMLTFHILENVGMTMGLMPVTGIPLPFISHGGTFLLSNMICIGLALSVGMKREGLSFSRDA
ncbi:MAG: FtsW/RodA/SpoVE family cell cycle protein, partial [Tissierellales bacterium]